MQRFPNSYTVKLLPICFKTWAFCWASKALKRCVYVLVRVFSGEQSDNPIFLSTAKSIFALSVHPSVKAHISCKGIQWASNSFMLLCCASNYSASRTHRGVLQLWGNKSRVGLFDWSPVVFLKVHGNDSPWDLGENWGTFDCLTLKHHCLTLRFRL